MTDRVIRIVVDPSGAKTGSAQVEQSLKRISGQADQAKRSVSGFRTAAIAAIAALGAREINQYAESWQNTQNRIKLVTDSQQELTTVQNALIESANRTRTSYESTVELYARVARSASELGLSQNDLLGITETVNQAIQVSGATAAEASAGVIQFAQGLASGALRGDELRSVLEQMPRLARALADGLGVSIGELRELGAEGELTTAKVVKALQDTAPQIAAEFDQLDLPLSTAFTNVTTNLTALIGTIDQALGATGRLGDEVNDLAQFLKDMREPLTGRTLDVAEFGAVATATFAKLGTTVPAQLNTFAATFNGTLNQLFGNDAAVEKNINEQLEAAARVAEANKEWQSVLDEIRNDFNERRRNLYGGDEDLDARQGAGLSKGDERAKNDIKAIQKRLDALALERDSIGKTRNEIELLKLERKGATAEEIAAAAATLETISARNREIDLINDRADAAEKLAEAETEARENAVEFIREQQKELELLKLTTEQQAAYNAEKAVAATLDESLIALAREQAIEIERLTEKREKDEEALEKQQKRVEDLADSLAANLTSAFEDAILSGDSLGDVLTGLADDIAKLIIRITVLQPLAEALTDAFGGSSASSSAAASSGGGGGGIFGFFKGLLGFQNGGSFTVGGSGGPDSQLVAFRASPDERVTVQTPGQQGQAGPAQIIVNNFAGQDTDIQQNRRTGPSGEEIVEIEVRKAFQRMARNGSLDPIMQTFGVSRELRPRG